MKEETFNALEIFAPWTSYTARFSVNKLENRDFQRLNQQRSGPSASRIGYDILMVNDLFWRPVGETCLNTKKGLHNG